MNLPQLARLLNRTAIVLRDVNAVKRAVEESNLAPVARRVGNKLIGKVMNRVSRPLWFRGGKKS